MPPGPNVSLQKYYIPSKHHILEENSKTKVYYGICETRFQLQYANHKKCSNTQPASQILWYLTNFGK